ncbi:MAG: hypothetical protein LBE38_10650 [Deltaproteobacteria bacterium]|nr:hypothetical protein [Deltaproteobacteria bacterium]
MTIVRTFSVFILTIIIALGSAGYLFAEVSTVQRDQSVQDVRLSSLSSQVFMLGRDLESPLVLAAAVELTSDIPTDPNNCSTDIGTDMIIPQDGIQPCTSTRMIEELAGAARAHEHEIWSQYARNMASQVSNRASSDAIIEQGGSIPPNSDVVIFHSFEGGEVAAVSAISWSNLDVSVEVYDQDDNFIAEAGGNRSTAFLEWIPQGSSEFKIKVINANDSPMDFTISSN